MKLIFVYCNFTEFVISNSFLVASLGFLHIMLCHLQTEKFTTLFPIWMTFISFSCLIALDKTSGTMLNRSGESGHPYLVPDLRGNAFTFSPLSTMLALGLSYIVFIMLRYISYISNLRVFIMKGWDVEFCRFLFSASIEIIVLCGESYLWIFVC